MKHILGMKYRVNQFSMYNYTYYDSKRAALIAARVLQKTNGGDWVIARIYRSGRVEKLRTVGGHFTDWPGENW